jgi:hypothetical protein
MLLAVDQEPTILRWKDKWQANASWRPWNVKENRGKRHGLFTDFQEGEITETIISKYVDTGRSFTSAMFMAVAMDKWTKLSRGPSEFKCPDKSICAFKEPNRFSSRRCHVKRRDPDGDNENIEVWIKIIKDMMAAHRANNLPDMIMNCDETAWRIIPSGLLTEAPVGRDGVLLRLDGKEKDYVTVLAGITAKGTKLPFLELRKEGRRERRGPNWARIRRSSEITRNRDGA